MTCHLHFPSFRAINDLRVRDEIVLWNLKWYFFALSFNFFQFFFYHLGSVSFILYFDSNKFYTSSHPRFLCLCRTLLSLTNEMKWYFYALFLLLRLRTAAVKRNVLSQSAFVENLLSFLQRKFLFLPISSTHSMFFRKQRNFTLFNIIWENWTVLICKNKF